MSDVMDGWYKRPLDCAMPNLDAWRLGEAALNAAATRAGDLIDTGLVLLRLINEAGYDVIPNISTSQWRLGAREYGSLSRLSVR